MPRPVDNLAAKNITAAVTTAPGSGFQLRPLHLEAPREDEVLVAIAAVGICHTDLLCADGVSPAPTPDCVRARRRRA